MAKSKDFDVQLSQLQSDLAIAKGEFTKTISNVEFIMKCIFAPVLFVFVAISVYVVFTV